MINKLLTVGVATITPFGVTVFFIGCYVCGVGYSRGGGGGGGCKLLKDYFISNNK